MARSQHTKDGTRAKTTPANGATGLRNRKPEGVVKSTAAVPRADGQSTERGIEAGYRGGNFRDNTDVRKPPLPTPMRTNSSTQPAQMSRPMKSSPAKDSVQTPPTSRSQRISQSEVSAGQSRAETPAGTGLSDRQPQMKSVPPPAVPFRAPPSNLTVENKPSTSLSKTARDMLRAKIKATKPNAPSHPRAAPKTDGRNDDTKPAPYIELCNTNGLPLASDTVKPSAATNRVQKSVSSVRSARNDPAPPSASSAVHDILAEISTDRGVAPGHGVKKTVSTLSESAKVERETPISKNDSIARSPAMRPSSRLSTTAVAPAHALDPDAINMARSVSKADTASTQYTGTANGRPTGPSTVERRPEPPSISQRTVSGPQKNRLEEKLPARTSLSQRRNERAQPQAIRSTQPRTSIPTPPQPFPAPETQVPGSNVQTAPIVPSRPHISVAASIAVPAPIRTQAAPSSRTKASTVQEEASLPALSTDSNARSRKKASVDSDFAPATSAPAKPAPATSTLATSPHTKSAPCKPAPAKPRSKTHVRVPSGPSDFDVFVPPVPGAPEVTPGGGSIPKVQHASTVVSSHPNNITGHDISTAVKNEEPGVTAVKSTVSEHAVADRFKQLEYYGAGSQSPHKNEGKVIDLSGNNYDTPTTQEFAEQNVPANNVHLLEKCTPKIELLSPQKTGAQSGLAQVEGKYRDSEKGTAAHLSTGNPRIASSDPRDESKNTATSIDEKYTLTKVPTYKENKTTHDHNSTKQEARSTPLDCRAAPVEHEKLAPTSRHVAGVSRKVAAPVRDSDSNKVSLTLLCIHFLRVGVLNIHPESQKLTSQVNKQALAVSAPEPAVEVIEVVQDLSGIVSKDRATTLSSLEPYFSYRIKQKIWSETGSEQDATTTEVGFSSTVLETANRHAEEVFTQIKHQYTSTFPVQHKESTSSHNDDGCLKIEGTLALIGWPVKQVFVKVWVERGIGKLIRMFRRCSRLTRIVQCRRRWWLLIRPNSTHPT